MGPDSELIIGSPRTASALSRAVKAGRARRLAHGLFTRDLETDPSELVRRNFLEVTGHFCPGAVISDRSAPAAMPDAQGLLFVVHPRARPVVLPGLTVVPRPGLPAQPDDVALPFNVWLSSRARGLVENLRPSRAVKGRPPRTLTEPELHRWIAHLSRSEGPARLNAIRDRARELARVLSLEDAFPRLDDAIGAALGTRQIETRAHPLAAAQRGLPYDERRDEAFAALADHLQKRAPAPRVLFEADRRRRDLLPFFEAYFSNFIEGTEFTVDEASAIILQQLVPDSRPADAHDVLATFRVVADEQEMRRIPASAAELIALLRERHARLLAKRPEKRPGEFKQRANRAGSTEFVAPQLVEGTLARGFFHLQALEDPFARAVLMMFLVSEVHPFDDGNGRVARVMMNAELVTSDEHRIVIPTVFRNEYLSGLRAMTHNRQPGPLTRVLDFAQRFTAEMDFSDLQGAKALLERTHAFLDSTEAEARGLRLTLPSALR